MLTSLVGGSYACVLILTHFGESSVKHEYEGDWSENTRLTTCDPHAKRAVTNSESPQEVDDKKEIIFTYDVEFHVRSYISWHCIGCLYGCMTVLFLNNSCPLSYLAGK